MVTNFFATTTDDWHDPSGALHAYLVPEPGVRSRLAPAMQAARGLPFLAVQPEESLHATILRLPILVADLTADDAAGIRIRATKSGTALDPITLEFGRPHITPDSLLVSSAPDNEHWGALVALVREAAAQVPGLDVNRYPPPSAPHMTIAYATSEGDDDLIRAALSDVDDATAALDTVAFTTIAWCGVHQKRDKGIYTFDVLFETPAQETGMSARHAGLQRPLLWTPSCSGRQFNGYRQRPLDTGVETSGITLPARVQLAVTSRFRVQMSCEFGDSPRARVSRARSSQRQTVRTNQLK